MEIDKSIETAEAEVKVKKPVWGGWATAGFGLVILIASFIVQGMVAVVFIVAIIIAGPQGDPPPFMESFINIAGLIVAIATIPSAIVSVALIFAFIKNRKGAGIKEYLGLKAISKKTVLVVLAISAGFLILSEGLALIIKPQALKFVFIIN